MNKSPDSVKAVRFSHCLDVGGGNCESDGNVSLCLQIDDVALSGSGGQLFLHSMMCFLKEHEGPI